ncbi:hypothetical protein [Streptomyces sp. TLI_171]|uniref:hypothetical protein n=1 Tax=Streptomyces sp. TLI_171 TaxID=1938859 RepID=UPI000C176D30|nr:hypothetical protein [Streptomyces sp. TLI_171]RKE22012.1 hypothetical protein BX266_5421 [Streptomyces sp. TLI_171]
MPEHYSSIGEAVGAAMRHNIALAHGPQADPPLQVRYFPPPAADPYSLPGMIARLEVTADPGEVAAIVEEATGALVGPLPQLTELVAASADWARARLNFDYPDPYVAAFDLWTRLASVHSMLVYAQEELEAVVGNIAEMPAALSDPRHHEMVQVKRTRELLHDVMGHGPSDAEAMRQQAAVSYSPRAAARRAASPADESAAPAAGPSPSPGRTR